MDGIFGLILTFFFEDLPRKGCILVHESSVKAAAPNTLASALESLFSTCCIVHTSFNASF